VDKSAHSLVIKMYCSRRALARAAASPILVFLLAACVALQAYSVPRAAAQTAVDLELVIAVDVSLSMDLDEQRLQRDGYVAAFRDVEIHKAITSGAYARIAVTYMEWAGPVSQSVVIPWTVLDGPAAAVAFADKLEALPISRARLTSISAALKFSQDLFGGSGAKGIRRVIDVSGDGPNNAGEPVVPVRDELVAGGIGGTGAFMVPVKELKEFASAIRRKLLLEISGFGTPARVIPAQNALPAEGYDCLTGEKRWRQYFDRIPN
jgi:hypothetical protein